MVNAPQNNTAAIKHLHLPKQWSGYGVLADVLVKAGSKFWMLSLTCYHLIAFTDGGEKDEVEYTNYIPHTGPRYEPTCHKT